jgi:hypothetical protein
MLSTCLVAALVVIAPPRPGADLLAQASSSFIGSTGPAELTALFDLEPDGLLGADYQRSLELPDGRVL